MPSYSSLPPPSEKHVAARERLENERAARTQLIEQGGPVTAPHMDIVAYTRHATAREVIAKIDAALRRMEEGGYGRCTRCGVKIPAGRLAIVPYTEGCVDCES